ncbi:nuclear transport factor 2 family protein [Kribbella sp. NPDC055071]
MSERADFLAWFETELHDAEIAVHNGDAGKRDALWSTRDPVTVFGAWKTTTTSAQTRALFQLLADSFSGSESFAYELVSADVAGDLAYTIAFEHTVTHVNGELRTYSLRVTQLYRREDGAWKVFHRHGDTKTDAQNL